METTVVADDDLDDLEDEQLADKFFDYFQRRIECEPTQILRYGRAGQPLWLGSVQPSAADIPLCPVCHGPRSFEFQIMPQLMQHLAIDESDQDNNATLDLGVIAIYTCNASCAGGPSYCEEVAWQNKVNDDSRAEAGTRDAPAVLKEVTSSFSAMDAK